MGSHGGEGSPDIFYYTEYVYILSIVTGVSSLTRTIPIWNEYTPCVATGTRIRRVYSYSEYIHALCRNGDELSHQDYSFT